MYHNFFIIAVYVPHEGVVCPNQVQILDDLRQALATLPGKHDCVVVMGDFNVKLPRGKKNLTGNFCMHANASAGGTELLEIMSDHCLTAVSTFFKPSKKATFGNATYHKPETEGRKRVLGQIDYVLVSMRWSSSVKSCKVHWGPSLICHKKGVKWDHGMLVTKWHSKIKGSKKKEPPADLTVLNDDLGAAKFEAVCHAFLHQKWVEGGTETPSLEEEYEMMSSAVADAIDLLPKVERKRGKVRERSERTKDLFRRCAEQCQGLEYGSPRWRAKQTHFLQAIRHSCREDYRSYVEKVIEEIRVADMKGDASAVAKGVSQLAGTGKGGYSKQPTKKTEGADKGKLFNSPQELAAAWTEFAKLKFEATCRESGRGEMPDLGAASERAHEILTDKILSECLNALGATKAAGWDKVTAEAYRASPSAKEALFRLVRNIWREERLPADLAKGVFVPFFKNKGSADDMTKYRFICLLTHGFKMLSMVLLRRVEEETANFLPEYQAGFRKKRGTRDNIFVLAELFDFVVQSGSMSVTTFIDFVAAFDSVSHHFLDESLGEAGASAKSRAVFRAIYDAANAVVRVKDASGKDVLSDPFGVFRGVLQGDIFSPVAFIIALNLIMVRHDCCQDCPEVRGVPVPRLDYADDSALQDTSVANASTRVSKLAKGAREDADMVISVPKTEIMQVKAQAPISRFREEDVKMLIDAKVSTVCCDSCGRVFDSTWGRDRHTQLYCEEARREIFDEEFSVKKILNARGPPARRFYQVDWGSGVWKAEENIGWEPARHLTGTATGRIEEFWVEHPELDKDADLEVKGENRCTWCNRFCNETGRWGLPYHLTVCKHKPSKRGQQDRTVKAVQKQKAVKAQEVLEQVLIEGEPLKNVFNFSSLGFMMQADGNREHAVVTRMGQARSSFGKLRHIWKSSCLSLKAKLQLYQSGVCSVLVYGNEAWKLTSKVAKMLRGWNARCLAQISGRDVPEECRSPSFDLLAALRVRRLRWVGCVLRKADGCLDRRVLVSKTQPYDEGDVLADCPGHNDMSELISMASDRGNWCLEVNALQKRLA